MTHCSVIQSITVQQGTEHVFGFLMPEEERERTIGILIQMFVENMQEVKY